MKKYLITATAAFVVALTGPVAADDTVDFSNQAIQCTGDYVTKEVSEIVEHSPMGHLLGVHMLYLKDMKELWRTNNELRCEANLFLNTSQEGEMFLIRLLNQDGHALIGSHQKTDRSDCSPCPVRLWDTNAIPPKRERQ
jgi:hypothetical protein